jgi:hypothetical protein
MTGPTYRATRTSENGQPIPEERRVEHTGMPLEQVARLVELDEDEIAWAIEENGVCETDAWTIEEEA